MLAVDPDAVLIVVNKTHDGSERRIKDLTARREPFPPAGPVVDVPDRGKAHDGSPLRTKGLTGGRRSPQNPWWKPLGTLSANFI